MVLGPFENLTNLGLEPLSEGMCQCEKYSDFEYFSNTVKFTSKSYHFLKEDSQSSDDENKIMRDPKNGKLEFGNIFMN